MRFAVQLYPWERWPDWRALGDFAVGVEDLGYDAVVLSEHLATPLTGEQHPVGTTWPEIYVLAAYLSGRTSNLRFTFDATVIPYRHPIHLAGEIATLDQVSAGRLTIVAGIGWMRSEFDALGVPFATRGARTDESLRAMRAIWTQPEAEFHGEHISFDRIALRPGCVQQPHVPILIGGVGAHARRRIAELGAGWGAPIPWPLERLGREITRIRDAVADAGRDPTTLQFVAGMTFGRPDATAMEAFAHVGSIPSADGVAATAPEAIELVDRFRRLGVTDLVVSTDWTAPDGYLGALAWFADEVIRAR